ncbi:hypothetical protein BC940DRAFT_66000 [Gongronella butleri]|nr:hypothetical protein BC940DRAFT_66000 [Gongronella butleri]
MPSTSMSWPMEPPQSSFSYTASTTAAPSPTLSPDNPLMSLHLGASAQQQDTFGSSQPLISQFASTTQQPEYTTTTTTTTSTTFAFSTATSPVFSTASSGFTAADPDFTDTPPLQDTYRATQSANASYMAPSSTHSLNAASQTIDAYASATPMVAPLQNDLFAQLPATSTSSSSMATLPISSTPSSSSMSSIPSMPISTASSLSMPAMPVSSSPSSSIPSIPSSSSMQQLAMTAPTTFVASSTSYSSPMPLFDQQQQRTSSNEGGCCSSASTTLPTPRNSCCSSSSSKSASMATTPAPTTRSFAPPTSQSSESGQNGQNNQGSGTCSGGCGGNSTTMCEDGVGKISCCSSKQRNARGEIIRVVTCRCGDACQCIGCDAHPSRAMKSVDRDPAWAGSSDTQKIPASNPNCSTSTLTSTLTSPSASSCCSSSSCSSSFAEKRDRRVSVASLRRQYAEQQHKDREHMSNDDTIPSIVPTSILAEDGSQRCGCGCGHLFAECGNCFDKLCQDYYSQQS